MRRGTGGRPPVPRAGPDPDCSADCPTRPSVLRWQTARAEDRAPWRHDPSADPGAKTEGGRHDAALSSPFGIGMKAANRGHLIGSTVYLISQPLSLHFTLNHYNALAAHLLDDLG